MGSITLSCGHVWNESMGPWQDLDFSYETEDCDAVEGWIPCTVYGSYCPDCQKKLKEEYK